MRSAFRDTAGLAFVRVGLQERLAFFLVVFRDDHQEFVAAGTDRFRVVGYDFLQDVGEALYVFVALAVTVVVVDHLEVVQVEHHVAARELAAHVVRIHDQVVPVEKSRHGVVEAQLLEHPVRGVFVSLHHDKEARDHEGDADDVDAEAFDERGQRTGEERKGVVEDKADEGSETELFAEVDDVPDHDDAPDAGGAP